MNCEIAPDGAINIQIAGSVDYSSKPIGRDINIATGETVSPHLFRLGDGLSAKPAITPNNPHKSEGSVIYHAENNYVYIDHLISNQTYMFVKRLKSNDVFLAKIQPIDKHQ
jgi:hypothetical protein